jgi:hypothetical protein
MSGTGKTREERQQSMCIGAKLCTGKAKDREEAEKICAEAATHPKPTVKTGTRSRKCKIDVPTMAACVIEGMAGKEITLANLTPVIAGCSGQKVAKPLTEKKFMRKCVKENQITGKINEMQGIVNKCKLAWKEQHEAG